MCPEVKKDGQLWSPDQLGSRTQRFGHGKELRSSCFVLFFLLRKPESYSAERFKWVTLIILVKFHTEPESQMNLTSDRAGHQIFLDFYSFLLFSDSSTPDQHD